MGDPLVELAHDLKTPLTGVLGAIELVLDPAFDLDEAEVADLLSTARAEGNHLRAIIDGVVQRSRIADGTLRLDLEPLAVVDLVDASFNRFAGVSNRTSVVGDLDAKVESDRDLAEQVITNLAQNIRRYAPEGPVTVEVRRLGEQVEITVRDSGPGLDAERESQGLGIGLRTASDIAEHLGGSLRIDPTPPSGGASFTVTLPATDEEIRSEVVDRDVTVPPKARLLAEVAHLVSGTSIDRTLGGVARLSRTTLSAAETAVVELRNRRLVVRRADTTNHEYPPDELSRSLLAEAPGTVTPIDQGSVLWLSGIEGEVVSVTTMGDGVGLLVTAWEKAEHRPLFADEVLPGLSTIAMVGVERRSMDADIDFERRVRSAVMDSLPIAISVFAGDPPKIIEMNRAEAEMLGIEVWDDRGELGESQRRFDVRFEDGTPLDEENAPVVRSIRTGESTGPFVLRVTRADGSELTVRTYCAPVADADGAIIGAVVTSEPLD